MLDAPSACAAPAVRNQPEAPRLPEHVSPVHLVGELPAGERGRDLAALELAKWLSGSHTRRDRQAEGQGEVQRNRANHKPERSGGHGSGRTFRASKRVTLSALVQNATLPGVVIEASTAMNSSRPSNETA